MPNIPTTEERFAGVIENNVQSPPYGGVIGISHAAKACADIHNANVQELLDELELLVAPGKEQEFSTLKTQYFQV